MVEPGDELVEEVDEAGRVLRVVTRREMRRDHLRHRAVFIAVVNSSGHLLVHRRSDDKDVWPSRWDLAAGGVMAVGEAWEDGAHRELAEELGVLAPIDHVGGGHFDDEEVAVVGQVFVARHDGPVRFDDGEVVEARWVGLDGLDRLCATRSLCPDSVALVLPLVRPLLSP